MASIDKVAVLGAGVMGAQIAAHCANAGLDVLLLDMERDGAPLARAALAKLAETEPAPFMSKRFAQRVTPGTFDRDMAKLANCDWIVEAVVERLDVKRDLHARAFEAAKPNAILSSNTSTLPRAQLIEGLAPEQASRFLITHFFNPPRYMRLLEIVGGEGTEAIEARFAEFASERLGKAPIACKDTPGFIANRLGVFWIQAAIAAALEHGLSIEEADAVMGKPFGFPKTGIFGLIDLVGLDLIPHVDRSMSAALPKTDRYHAIRPELPLVERLIEEGYTGRKGKGGFYRLDRSGGGKVKQAIDLRSGEWAKAKKPHLLALEAGERGGPIALLEAGDRASAFAKKALGETLAYACAVAEAIGHDIASIDRAMRLGYNWKRGPFELIDDLGVDRVRSLIEEIGAPSSPLLDRAVRDGGFYASSEAGLSRLGFDGARQPIARPEGALTLEDVKARAAPIAEDGAAAYWDLGDGVLCFELRTKMNTLDDRAIAMLGRAEALVKKHGRALVIHSDATHFSAGANLGLALFAANIAAWEEIERLARTGQRAIRALKWAKFPVIAAPAGLALGGGCEICLAADAVVAHAESYVGLVEVGVGIVPAWGGCAEMLARAIADPKKPKGPIAPTLDAFRTIALATVAKSAFEAKEIGYFGEDAEIVFDRERVLPAAKARAIALSDGYAPPEKPSYALSGATARAAIELAVHDLELKGMVTPHDRVVVDALAHVLSGGDADPTSPIDEAAILKLEREAFMALAKTEGTLLRMEHMLENGKPLRN